LSAVLADRGGRPTPQVRSAGGGGAEPSSSSCHLDVALAEAPAQPDLPAVRESREVDEPGLDLPEGHLALDEPGHAGLHLVDEALHPEAHQATGGGGLRVAGIGIVVRCRGRSLARNALAVVAPRSGQDGVTEADQLGPLVTQVEQDPFDVRKGVVRLVDAVEAGHPRFWHV
jgi:hypothetical protein